jgi:TPR repeat protein
MRYQLKHLFFLLVFPYLLCVLFAGEGNAQTHPNSPAFKDYTPPGASPLVKPIDEAHRDWQNFTLIRDANSGDAIAQHELGIRYFIGEGVPADTVQAAYWIKKAAAQKLVPAMFNYGIFELNGWGVAWNPFDAYENFLYAAQEEMTDAQYVLGIFLMDNLVVRRNESEAYCLVKTAADSGFEPAFELLAELAKHGNAVHNKSQTETDQDKTASPMSTSSLGLIFLDFSRDTTSHTNDTVLVDEALRDGGEALHEHSVKSPSNQLPTVDSSWIAALQASAEAGSPEALTLLGRCYERGTSVKKDTVQATVQYLRAIRLESPRAAELLWNLVREHGYFEKLKSRIDENDPDAQYAWAGLIALQFDYQLTPQQALELLEKAASHHHTDALIELGTCFAQGRWVSKNRQKAIAYWQEAAKLGSNEAHMRIMIANLTTKESLQQPAPDSLRRAMQRGSVLAQIALGYSYETGIGVKQDKAEAARLYRNAAQRGNRTAYTSLKRMFDDIRPKKKEFVIPE